MVVSHSTPKVRFLRIRCRKCKFILEEIEDWRLNSLVDVAEDLSKSLNGKCSKCGAKLNWREPLVSLKMTKDVKKDG